jgi:hypothetical protein
MTADADQFYRWFHGAREKLCSAQTHVEHDQHRSDLQDALNTIDRLGAFYAPAQWSKHDEPPLPGEDGAPQ